MPTLLSGCGSRAAAGAAAQRRIAAAARAMHTQCAGACGGRVSFAPGVVAAAAARTPQQLPNAAAPRRVACSASSAGQAAPAEERARRAELVKGCNTVLAELAGLDFPRIEVQKYVARAVTPPPKHAGFDVKRASAALDALMAPAGEDGRERTEDTEALVVLNAMLSDMWRWRRRGGFGRSDEDSLPHVQALQALQGMERTANWVEETQEDGERVTSSLLDSLPISDAQKSEMSGAVQQAAMGAINGAVWGSLVAGLAAVIAFAFLRN
ncbi:MAG: hypothetical protein J3K34DRAFT_119519 [Monoraphidium minutum]|nr:MAG: hypothetical protein J3K34DRAFT_119519 [Monoraphidium minutum]